MDLTTSTLSAQQPQAEGGAAHDAASADRRDYAAFLDASVKERDFMLLQPWRRGRAENQLAWGYRAVRTGATRFGLDARKVAGDLERALDARTRELRRRYLSRVPAWLEYGYSFGLKRALARILIQPALEWKHVRRWRPPVPLDHARRVRERGTTPKATIVVVSYNRLAYLQTTLSSLWANTDRNDYELIVVDNGSADGSADLLRALAEEGAIDKLILLRENRGTSGGFNIGFAAADPATQYLIKLDSDITLLTSGWLSRFDAFFAKVPDAGVVAMVEVNHLAHILSPRQREAGEEVISWNFWVVGGAGMTIRRALFDRLGYFCEVDRLKYITDDVDYANRVAVLGLRSFYLCGTRAYHREDLADRYAALEKQKRDESPASRAAVRSIRMEYVTGARDLYVSYPQYESFAFPEGQRVLELA